MHYLKLPHKDSPVSIFSICQAHQQLEADYNVDGILLERRSNQRRNESTGVQLARMKYHSSFEWVDIENLHKEDSPDDRDVRDIYTLNVLNMGLPISHSMANYIRSTYTKVFMDNHFPNWQKRIMG